MGMGHVDPPLFMHVFETASRSRSRFRRRRGRVAPKIQVVVPSHPDFQSTHLAARDGQDFLLDSVHDAAEEVGYLRRGEHGAFDGRFFAVAGQTGGVVGGVDEFVDAYEEPLYGFHFDRGRRVLGCGRWGLGFLGSEGRIDGVGDSSEGWFRGGFDGR